MINETCTPMRIGYGEELVELGKEYDDIIVLQDVFPAIFAYLFQDPKFLEAKVEPATFVNKTISGAAVVGSVIEGGIHNGEPFFTGESD